MRNPKKNEQKAKNAAKKADPKVKNNKSRKKSSDESPKYHDVTKHLDADSKVKPDKKLTDREIKFLEIYFSNPGIPLHTAARMVGYKAKHNATLDFTAKRILQKYEGLTDHKEIFRRMGCGEAKVAEMLIDLAKNATSETVKLNAIATLTKVFGMQKDQLDLGAGAEINIRPAAAPAPGSETEKTEKKGKLISL